MEMRGERERHSKCTSKGVKSHGEGSSEKRGPKQYEAFRSPWDGASGQSFSEEVGLKEKQFSRPFCGGGAGRGGGREELQRCRH